MKAYYGANVAAAAVAAHECDTLLQHAQAYSMLQLRFGSGPGGEFRAALGQWILLAGILWSTLSQFYC